MLLVFATCLQATRLTASTVALLVFKVNSPVFLFIYVSSEAESVSGNRGRGRCCCNGNDKFNAANE